MPKFREFKDQESKWVKPFEDVPFRVHIRRLTDHETNRIFDKNKIYPGSPKNSMVKLEAASREMLFASVIEWEHPESTPLGDVPCDEPNKARLQNITVTYDRDSEEVQETLFAVLSRAFNEEASAEAKN
jgi:hypothetical protein